MLRGIILAAALALTGCASNIMEGYVGQPLQVAMARYGAPALIFDMPDGRRAFQWEMTEMGVTPTTTLTNANIYAPPGAFANINASQTTFGGNPYSHTCRYTMYASWQDNAWVFTGFEKPGLGCE